MQEMEGRTTYKCTNIILVRENIQYEMQKKTVYINVYTFEEV